MKTITTYDIYRHAWNDLLGLMSREEELNEAHKAKTGRDNSIRIRRIEKYSAQMDELRDELIRLEQEMREAANQ